MADAVGPNARTTVQPVDLSGVESELSGLTELLLGPPGPDPEQIPGLASAISNMPQFQEQSAAVDSLVDLISKTGAAKPQQADLASPLAGLANFVRGGALQVPGAPKPHDTGQALRAAEMAANQKAILTNTILKGVKSLSGGKTGSKKRPKEFELKSAGFANSIEEGEKALDALAAEGFDPSQYKEAIQSKGFFGVNTIRNEKVRRFVRATKGALNAILRRESGAAIKDDEYAYLLDVYIPLLGDGSQILQEKRDARLGQLAVARTSAGPDALEELRGQLSKVKGEFPSLKNRKKRGSTGRGDSLKDINAEIRRRGLDK